MTQIDHSTETEQREEMASVPNNSVDYKVFMQLFINKLPEDKDPSLIDKVQLLMYKAYTQMAKTDTSNELLQLIGSISSPKEETTMTSKYHLADRCKTSFTKIIWALNEMKMLKTSDGMLPSNKQDVIEEFGKFLHTDLSEYSTLLSRSKAQDKEEGFLEVIRNMEESLKKYYYK